MSCTRGLVFVCSHLNPETRLEVKVYQGQWKLVVYLVKYSKKL
jgi:hypothetical protein